MRSPKLWALGAEMQGQSWTAQHCGGEDELGHVDGVVAGTKTWSASTSGMGLPVLRSPVTANWPNELILFTGCSACPMLSRRHRAIIARWHVVVSEDQMSWKRPNMKTVVEVVQAQKRDIQTTEYVQLIIRLCTTLGRY